MTGWRGLRALGRDGVTSIEFAVGGLVIVLLVVGTVEIARMLWAWQVLQSVAADTARCVAVADTACASSQTYAVTLAKQRGISNLKTSDVVVNTAATCGASNFVSVTITYTFNSVISKVHPPAGGLKGYACYPKSL